MEDKSEQDKIKNKQEEKALNQNRKEIEQDKHRVRTISLNKI